MAIIAGNHGEVIGTHGEDVAPPSLTTLADINGRGVAVVGNNEGLLLPFLDVVTHCHRLRDRIAFFKK